MSEVFGGADERLRSEYRALVPDGDHPDEETWVRFASGSLAGRAHDDLVDHVIACRTCAEIYRALGTFQDRARETGLFPDTALGAGGRRWWSTRSTWMPLAAVAVLASGVVLLRSVGPAPTTPPADSTSAPAPDVRPAGPRTWAALPSEAPAVELPARYALAMRGNAADPAFLKAFGTAIAPYRDRRFTDAARALDAVVRDHPDVPEAQFYLGVSRLLAGDAAGARAPLDSAMRADALGGAARWYGAVAAERAGDGAAADAALDAMCTASGEYQARACAARGRPMPPR
jgi:hypothetical protein